MQSVSQVLFSTLALNETFQDHMCLLVTRLDSSRIVKNIALVIGKYKLIVDAMLASLASCLKATDEKYADTNIH